MRRFVPYARPFGRCRGPSTRSKAASTARSFGVYRGRATCRPITASWWRSTTIPRPSHQVTDRIRSRRETAAGQLRGPYRPC